MNADFFITNARSAQYLCWCKRRSMIRNSLFFSPLNKIWSTRHISYDPFSFGPLTLLEVIPSSVNDVSRYQMEAKTTRDK